MMSAWAGQIPAGIAAVAILILPGLPTALFIRARGLLRLGIAITVSLAIIAVATLVAPVLGLGWSLLPVIIVSAAVSLIAAVLWLAGRRRAVAIDTQWSGWIWVSLAVAFLGWAVLLIIGIGGPDHPNQLYDGLFHLNAIEFIVQTGNASPFAMTMATPGSPVAFYPTLWHALVSLVVPVAGSIVPATNVVTVIAVALVWPVAVGALAGVLFPRHPQASVWAPLTTFAFSVFPLGFLNWGVLYPNLLGMLILPVLIAVVLSACRAGLAWPQRTLLVLAALAAAGATALGHPSALLAGLALLVPFALFRACKAWRHSVRSTRVLIAVCTLAGLVLIVGIWVSSNVTTHAWLPSMTMGQAMGEVAFLSPVGRDTGLLLGPLAAVGIWQVVKDRNWWILGSYAVSICFFVVSASLPILGVRSLLVGVWYDDTTRVGALLAMIGLPLAALGAATAAGWLRRLWGSGRRAVGLLVALGIALLAFTHLLAVRHDVSFMRFVGFDFSEESQGLSPDEVTLFERAAERLTDSDLVIGDPLTGAGLFYAYSGQSVVFPHVTGSYGPDATLLARGLVSGDSEVCSAIDRLGVTYAFDFGDREIYENHFTTYDGLHGLNLSPVLTEVDRVGDAAMYEVTGCR